MAAGQFHKLIYSFTLAVFMLCGQSSDAFADDKISKLTKKNVKAFIERTTDLTTNNSDRLSPKKVAAYLDKHIEGDARFKSLMTYNIPGMPPQKTSLTLDKKDFIKSVRDGADKIEGYENLVEIQAIKVASNGKKAFVKTQSTEYATMPVPGDNGTAEDVPVEGVSKCTQVISLNKGIIQMFSANCTTKIHFLEY